MGAVRAGPDHEYWNHGETIYPYLCPLCGVSKDPQYRPMPVESTLLDVYTLFAVEEAQGPAKKPKRRGLPPKKPKL